MSIKDLRAKTGLSQSKFAALVGIPLNTLQNWEQGNRKPPEYVISLIEYKLRKEGLINEREEI